MQGHIDVCSLNDVQRYTLTKEPVRLGSGNQCEIVLKTPGVAAEHCALEWDSQSATWMLKPSISKADSLVRIRGSVVRSGVYLQNDDVIELPDTFIRFQRIPSLPQFRGEFVSEVNIQNISKLVLGRADATDTTSERVNLDAEDGALSRQHATLEKRGSEWMVTDSSKTGTRLNGQPFATRELLVGDRLELSSYTFEFTGYSLRSVPRVSGGKVSCQDIRVTLKSGRTILQDVSLQIERGTFTGILGGSGQGKSTLLNALCGLNAPTGGSVHINGVSISSPSEMAAAGIGFVPQDDIVHVEITVEQALHYSARLRLAPETPADAIGNLVDETIARLGLEEHRKKRISLLSGGQRKRVSIATELLSKPSVLFLDEPSSGLDPATEFSLMSLLNRLAKDCTVICTTHVLGNAQLFDKMVFVHGGHVVFEAANEREIAEADELTPGPDGDPGRPRVLRAAFEVALGYFNVDKLDDVYLKLAQSGKSGEEWHKEFLARKKKMSAPDVERFIPDPAQSQQRGKLGGGYLRGLMVLMLRQWSILRADPLNLVFILAQPLLIALIVGWVADDPVLRSFLCVVATLWFGCSNGAQQIVKEHPIFRRERICGLGIHCYLQSKYVFLGLVTSFQAILLCLVTISVAHVIHPLHYDKEDFSAKMMDRLSPLPKSTAVHDNFDVVTAGGSPNTSNEPSIESGPMKEPSRPFFSSLFARAVIGLGSFFEIPNNLLDATEVRDAESRASGLSAPMSVSRVFLFTVGLRLVSLLGTALVGIAIGLSISALVQNSTQAVLWVPLVLIPQILFGGIVVTRPEMTASVRAASVLVPSYASQRLMDVASIFGQTTPRMTNRTKYPVFLTPGGDQESIEWTLLSEKLTEKYDKVSDHNKSWQNLLVFPAQAGQHINVSKRSRGVRVYEDSVEQRDDVRYPMGTIYQNLTPAFNGWLTLLVWAFACYGVTAAGLVMSQSRR